jgi:PAS domain S-box-containing protein
VLKTTQYAEFAERLGEHKRAVAAVALPLLRQVGDALPESALGALQQTSDALAATLEELGAAEAELLAQNEDLFAARTELEVQGELYRSFFDLAPVAYVVSDAHGTIRHLNRAATRLFGRPVNGLVGKPLAVYIDPDDRDAFRTGLTRAVRDGGAERWPVRVDGRASGLVEVEVLAHAIPAAPGGRSLIYWMLIPSFGGDADLL